MSTITPDDLPTFPHCPGYGFRSDPFILVKIIEREGGFERTDRKWSQPRRTFDGTPLVDAVEGAVEDILHFWLAIGGMAGRFRFTDYTDYKSCRLRFDPSPTDQPLALNLDSPGGYQLVKQYVVGAFTHERPISRPVGSTVLVANEVGAAQTDWTLDEATGLLTPGGGFVGTPTTWGGEFAVKCRFNSSFSPQIVDKNIQDAEVSVIECREEP